MADWRQIRARIRRAKSGPDPTARLEQLFDKTRDGMVAFELAQLEETAGRIERATDWYTRAWKRFRRSEWRLKAEEALTRHGIPIPAATSEEPAEKARPREHAPEAAAEAPAAKEAEREEKAEAEAKAKPEAEAEGEAVSAAEAEQEAPSEAAPAPKAGASRRRRRRGGRGRGKARREAAPPAAEEPSRGSARPPARAPAPRAKEPEQRPAAERRPTREPVRERMPAIHVYRRGEPALASEIKTLEAKLRQLLASHPYPLDQLNEVPANPGVYLVSDLDLTTTYYLEACRNMRSATDLLVSGRRGRQGSVRARLARYLGISDGQASRYLKQHCAVRWMELEEAEAVALGHFATALLRPELMEESA